MPAVSLVGISGMTTVFPWPGGGRLSAHIVAGSTEPSTLQLKEKTQTFTLNVNLFPLQLKRLISQIHTQHVHYNPVARRCSLLVACFPVSVVHPYLLFYTLRN
jgi:hypothetical protein